ncbi:TIGR02679 domain-containing protein [Cohnella sp. 56]|uniref:TIGR02679 domain-containing protein n=1 Tax=Cohnella sp. 56 TaxID=3113722 RepID=UPI0030E8B36A
MNADNDSLRRAAAYFSREGFRQALEAVWRKYASLGRIGGKAVLEQATQEECEALGEFFGRYFRAGESIPIPLKQFEQELRESAFGIGLLELHLALEGKPLLTRSERQAGEGQLWQRLFEEVREAERNLLGAESAGASWLDEMERGTGPGLRTLRECYRADPEAARAALVATVRALCWLQGIGEREGQKQPIRLPVLAARVSGDAHMLDLNRPAGRLLIAALGRRLGMETAGSDLMSEPDAENDEERSGAGDPDASDERGMESVDGSESLRLRELYRRAGILDDDLSSIVHWFIPQTGRPALPTVWTLRQVEAESAGRFPSCSRIYAVENPAVFSTILDAFGIAEFGADGYTIALICTSGPASAAAIRWMQRCLEVSPPTCRLYYAGDFDIKGLIMAQTLQRLWPERFIPWRFDSVAYLEMSARCPGPAFDNAELERLGSMSVSWDSDLCGLMRQTGRKVHQEAWIDGLLQDFANASEGSILRLPRWTNIFTGKEETM